MARIPPNEGLLRNPWDALQHGSGASLLECGGKAQRRHRSCSRRPSELGGAERRGILGCLYSIQPPPVYVRVSRGHGPDG
ncbi:hypothetical protein SBV1_2140003 [Verrucomicrobia bacterium]|nr:hypothetical protein SBV1_2140003 [Verrucomicrobiota bacterium]